MRISDWSSDVCASDLFREQPMLDVLLDFGPEDLGRREMLEDRSGHRETAGNEGARDVTDNVAEGTVIGGTIARSADAEKRQNIVAADTDCRHALRIGQIGRAHV